jgi:fused signal recognition particle receptor
MFGFKKSKTEKSDKPKTNGDEPSPTTASQEQTQTDPEKSNSAKKGLFARLTEGLKRTRANITESLAKLVLGGKTIDAEVLEEIETLLLSADVGINATQSIVTALTQRLQRKQLNDAEALFKALREEMLNILQPVAQALHIPKSDKPYVILMVGINGAGKTTTIGKLAKRLQREGHKVLLAAGDTFRAAAVEQLQVWGERNKIPVIAQHSGADSASVVYDALQAAQARGIDVLIADTAGRLHTQSNLMEELKKVRRVMAKLDAAAPHEVLLVLDAGIGQNAIAQAKQFQQAVGVSGIALTKLDGTAKGGVIFSIANQLQIPIRLIGIGESIDDLRDFKAEEFVDALLEHASN